MASLAEIQWQRLLSTKVALFQERECKTILEVYDEATFRDFFEEICIEYHEPDRKTLFAKLQSSFQKSESFRAKLDEACPVEIPRRPAQLLWGACFAVIESGFASPPQVHRDLEKLSHWVALLCRLNDSVPAFLPLWTTLTTEERIQVPLQNIFDCFMNTCLVVISYLREQTYAKIDDAYTIPPLIQPEEYVAGSANVMGIAKGLFDIAANELDPNRDSSTGILAKDSNMPAILDYANQNPDDLRGRWTNKSMVGKGAFGYVWKSEERSSGMIFARKSMHYGTTGNKIKDEQEKAEREVLWEIEVEIMQQLRHVHITTVFFTLKEPSSFDIMMLPLADTNMGTFLEDCGDRRFLEARRKYIPEWMGCLTNALAFAHEQKIRHKDIKPANILVKGNQVFLSDFGLAVSFTDADVSFTTNDPGGTWKYKAPESEIGVPHGRAADIFGLGCVFSEMLTVFNFKSVSSFEKSRRLSGPPDIYFRTNLETTEKWILALRGNATSDFLAEVIINMLQLDPKLRKHADELKNEFESREGFCCTACRLRQA